MQFTIIKPDNRVKLGNFVTTSIDLSSVPSNIHAIQWNGTTGHIEWAIGGPNTTLTEITNYNEIYTQAERLKAEEEARAANPYYGMSLEEKQEAIAAKILEREMYEDFKPIEHPPFSGVLHKVTDAVYRTTQRLRKYQDSDPLPNFIFNGKWRDVNGVGISMTVGELRDLEDAIFNRAAVNDSNAVDHIASMKLAEDPLTYDYSTGWV